MIGLPDMFRDRYRILCAATVFLSSALLFVVQPMAAKLLLPRFGGAAGVWLTAMLFFQAALLAGYLYAHAAIGRLPPRSQAALHGLVLAAATVLLRTGFSGAGGTAANPWLGILWLLAAGLGLPYLSLAATTPLVQTWYARVSGGVLPYRLYAVSNFASLAALFAYPVLIEPRFTLRAQFAAWSGGFFVFALLSAAAAIGASRSKAVADADPGPGGPPGAAEAGVWFALAACASALWLAVANHLSQDIAPAPFLWVLPLGVYLLTFVLCFSSDHFYVPRLFRFLLPPAWAAFVFGLRLENPKLAHSLLLFVPALFVICAFCHGELARRKPPVRGLTAFYLLVAAGGAGGGLFVGVLAPILFNAYLELPIAVAASVLLALALLYEYAAPKHITRLAVVAAGALLIAVPFAERGSGDRLRSRNFYGALRVSDKPGPPPSRRLYHGSILHGVQLLGPGQSQVATTYYSLESGVGMALLPLEAGASRIGVIGLGVGTMAAYGGEGDVIRFYEINPEVIEVAKTHFSFLRESGAQIEIVPGDARVSLEREPPQNYDLLALDAFSSDSIPAHLLTLEAFQLYFRHLKPDGILAVHVTNKYLDLTPVVVEIARSLGKEVLLISSPSRLALEIYSARWLLVASGSAALEALRPAASPLPEKRVRVWTDDFTNLFEVLK